MRIPTPGDDDLDVIAETFVAVAEDGAGQVALAASIKLVHLGEFTASDRWDIVRFWGGRRARRARPEIAGGVTDRRHRRRAQHPRRDPRERRCWQARPQLEVHSMTATFSLADTDGFLVRSGFRVTHTQILEYPRTVRRTRALPTRDRIRARSALTGGPSRTSASETRRSSRSWPTAKAFDRGAEPRVWSLGRPHPAAPGQAPGQLH